MIIILIEVKIPPILRFSVWIVVVVVVTVVVAVRRVHVYIFTSYNDTTVLKAAIKAISMLYQSWLWGLSFITTSLL